MNIKDFYFHTISKDDKNITISIFEQILNDGMLKSQRLLSNNENKFNGLDYISLAKYIEPSEYKVLCLDEDSYNASKISNEFNSYEEYKNYLKLDNYIKKPLTKEEFFKLNNTQNKRDYFSYLDSLSRRYPIDIRYLYNKTNDNIYNIILNLIDDEILYCNKNEYCFEEYIRCSTGITFIFPKTIKVEQVNIIPNMPFEIEIKLVAEIQNFNKRYSNQIGEVQVKDYLNLSESIGIIVNPKLEVVKIKQILKNYNYNLKIYNIINDCLIEV